MGVRFNAVRYYRIVKGTRETRREEWHRGGMEGKEEYRRGVWNGKVRRGKMENANGHRCTLRKAERYGGRVLDWNGLAICG